MRGILLPCIISVISMLVIPPMAYPQVSESDKNKNVAADSSRQKTQLEKLRKAFDRVVGDQNDPKEPQPQEDAKETKDPELNLGGFVLDETRSKMGRDFYSMFYQNWEAPDKASNFSITITEKPTIGRGSKIMIKMDYENVFSARLQPKYEYIKALSKKAIARCQQIIRQKSNVKSQLRGY